MLHQLSDLAQHLSLAYERVTLPCSSMNCGDVIYRRYVTSNSVCELVAWQTSA